MIDKLSYDQILSISSGLKEQIEVIKKLVKEREMTELDDFISNVETYYKYLETTVQTNKDADDALRELAKRNNKEL